MTIENETSAPTNAWTWPPEWQPVEARSTARHRIGTRDEWASARAELLVREKEHTRLGDELARQRRELPWVRVEKDYVLDTGGGPLARLWATALAGLFAEIRELPIELRQLFAKLPNS